MDNSRLSDLIGAMAERRNREAFAALFRHFAPRLKAFGMRQGVDAGTAEELAQETMLSVWRKADTFDRRRANASTWIFTIFRNKRIDMLRRESRPEADLESVAELASDASGAEVGFHRVSFRPAGGSLIAESDFLVELKVLFFTAYRYRYTGDLRNTVWYDEDGRWVKMRFAAEDGSTIEYVCTQCRRAPSPAPAPS